MKLSSVYTSRQLIALHPLLLAWTKVVGRYCRMEEYDDNPWWFNERASLSTLAGAAWSLKGWSALEEFNTRKRGGAIPKDMTEDGSRYGRCDLYVATKGCWFAFEAKQAWYRMGAQHNVAQDVMKKAWNDAGALKITEAKHRLAATFVVPYFSKRDAMKKDHLDRIEAWLKTKPFASGRAVKARALAYVFSKKSYISDENGRAFPGVILVLEERQRANRRTAKRG